MRILHVIDSGGLYGAEIMLLNLMAEQRLMGDEPILASIGDKGIAEKAIETAAKERGLTVEVFRMRPGPNITGACKVLRFARREMIDVLHSHGYKGNILFGLIPRTLRGRPMVTTLHGWTWTGGLSRMMFYEWLDSQALRFVDKVVLVDEAMKHHPRLKSMDSQRLQVVPNGIPDHNPLEQALDPLMDNELRKFCEGGIVIGAVGRLSPEKGFGLLIEALAALTGDRSTLKLVIMGQGGLQAELEDQAAALGVADRIFFTGYVTHAAAYLHHCALMAIPSFTEGLPMALLEAMQAGVPVVASRVGGVPGVLEQGLSGLLVEPGNLASLVQGIEQTLENPAETALRVHRARMRVRNLYSSSNMAIRYHEIYLGTIEK